MRTIRLLAIAITALASAALVAPSAGATTSTASAEGRPFFELRTARLAPVPHDTAADGGSNASGRVNLVRVGDLVLVLEYVQGVDAALPHAQHIHGVGAGVCPSPDRAGDDGLINTLEAAPDYGSVQVSLTTRGDATPASALAVDRFPVANQLDTLLYARVLKIGRDIPAEVGYDLSEYHIVVHGIDINGNGAYDFDAGVSSLDPSLPLEATIPAACGEIR